MGKLTAKRQNFVREYRISLNATQAYKKAYGVSENVARRAGSRLLTMVDIRAELQKTQVKLAKKFDVTEESIMSELASIGYSNMRDYVDFGPVGVTLKEMSELTDIQTAAIQEVSHNLDGEGGGSVKFKLYDKAKALVDMGKHIGMFKKDAEGSGERPIFVGINLIINNGGSK